MSSENDNLDNLDNFVLDDLGVFGQGEEVVGQGEGDKQPDKRKSSEWSEEFLAKQNKYNPEYTKQRQAEEEGLNLDNLRLMQKTFPIDFTKEQVDNIGSNKGQKKTGGSRKKRSKNKTRSRKQSKTQKRSKSNTSSMKQKRSKNRRR